jgi:DNA-directed RNA polymerase subunit beta'
MLLDLVGLDSVQHYIIKDLNNIYMSNGIDVDEKHIEVIIRQMCNRAQIIEPGDSDFVGGDVVRVSSVRTVNKHLIQNGQKPAVYKLVVTGISRASLSTDSFLSAASFQETSRVLVEAALSSRKDYLVGLKENVILGQLIPSGTGFDHSRIQDVTAIQEEFDEIDSVVVEE